MRGIVKISCRKFGEGCPEIFSKVVQKIQIENISRQSGIFFSSDRIGLVLSLAPSLLGNLPNRPRLGLSTPMPLVYKLLCTRVRCLVNWLKVLGLSIAAFLVTAFACSAMAGDKNYRITMKTGEILEFNDKERAVRFVSADPEKIERIEEWRELVIKSRVSLTTKR